METTTEPHPRRYPVAISQAKRFIDYQQCCVDWVTKYGPTPRRVALPGIAKLYAERHTVGKGKPNMNIVFRVAENLQQVIIQGRLIRGPRPQQILTLPTS